MGIGKELQTAKEEIKKFPRSYKFLWLMNQGDADLVKWLERKGHMDVLLDLRNLQSGDKKKLCDYMDEYDSELYKSFCECDEDLSKPETKSMGENLQAAAVDAVKKGRTYPGTIESDGECITLTMHNCEDSDLFDWLAKSNEHEACRLIGRLQEKRPRYTLAHACKLTRPNIYLRFCRGKHDSNPIESAIQDLENQVEEEPKSEEPSHPYPALQVSLEEEVVDRIIQSIILENTTTASKCVYEELIFEGMNKFEALGRALFNKACEQALKDTVHDTEYKYATEST